MNIHKPKSRDKKQAARAEAWRNEWDKQLALLPQEKRDAISAEPMSGHADELDELVEKILCERGEL